MMKKLTAIISCVLICILFASCSGSEAGCDSSALDTQLAKEWFLKDSFNTSEKDGPVAQMYSDELYIPSLEGQKPESGSYFTLRLPKEEYLNDDIIRTHSTDLTKGLVREGKINSRYGVMHSGITSCASDILSILETKKEYISSKITGFEAEIQSEWSASIDVDAKAANQVLYVAYLPVIFTYYSDPNTMSVVSVIFVPVKTIVAKYEIENGERKYNDDFVTNTQNKLVTWKSSGAVIQSDSAR